ncbi:unnamed protein product [Prorocentrum cordatum]|uniref:Altered inheritance of mitochondria protein 24, mitochondrial n=1 Tax=Prorocentrum cordatum TaxID=2364126 RepID=A0ABN9V342_9DINO|nr:unnamed protein product [Polarella glacialis]
MRPVPEPLRRASGASLMLGGAPQRGSQTPAGGYAGGRDSSSSSSSSRSGMAVLSNGVFCGSNVRLGGGLAVVVPKRTSTGNFAFCVRHGHLLQIDVSGITDLMGADNHPNTEFEAQGVEGGQVQLRGLASGRWLAIGDGGGFASSGTPVALDVTLDGGSEVGAVLHEQNGRHRAAPAPSGASSRDGGGQRRPWAAAAPRGSWQPASGGAAWAGWGGERWRGAGADDAGAAAESSSDRGCASAAAAWQAGPGGPAWQAGGGSWDGWAWRRGDSAWGEQPQGAGGPSWESGGASWGGSWDDGGAWPQSGGDGSWAASPATTGGGPWDHGGAWPRGGGWGDWPETWGYQVPCVTAHDDVDCQRRLPPPAQADMNVDCRRRLPPPDPAAVRLAGEAAGVIDVATVQMVTTSDFMAQVMKPGGLHAMLAARVSPWHLFKRLRAEEGPAASQRPAAACTAASCEPPLPPPPPPPDGPPPGAAVDECPDGACKDEQDEC